MLAKERRQGARRRWGTRGRRRGQRQEPEAWGTLQHTPLARLWPRRREAQSAGTAPAEKEQQMALVTCQYTPPAWLWPRRTEAQ